MKETKEYVRLLEIMDDLREKCPWDKKQTMQSLRILTLEEVYELSDAILQENWEDIRGELGDVLLHIVFYAKIASEKAKFDMEDIAQSINEKLIHRHPHIYGDVEVENEEQVKENWEKLKLKEGKKSVLEGVPNSLPALIKSYRIQEKAKGVGFEWEKAKDVKLKVDEELEELEDAITSGSATNMEKEFGDVFFSLINYARFLGINPEDALEKTNKKFIHRFQEMENMADKKGLVFSELSLDEQEKLWQETKIKYP